MLGVCYYPEQWPESSWNGDLKAMAGLGIQSVRLAEFAWSRLEPAPGQFDGAWLDRVLALCLEHRLQVVLGTPTAAAPKWLVEAHPDILPLDAQGRRRRFGSRRHSCFAAPAWQAASERIVAAMGTRWGEHPAVVGWQIDNEFGCHDTLRCYCDHCAQAFRGWLARRYADVDELNRRWGTAFWSQTYASFAQVELPADLPHPALQLEFFRFASAQAVDYCARQASLLRPLSPGRFLTHNFMGNFWQLDAFALNAHLDLSSFDNYPLEFPQGWPRTGHPDGAAFHHDLHRRCGRGRFRIMEQQPGALSWTRHRPAPAPGMVRLWSWEALAHGAEQVSYFRWRQTPTGQEQLLEALHHPDGTPAPGLAEVAQVSAELISLSPAEKASVALVIDFEAAWAGEILEWDYPELVGLFYEALRSLGHDVDVVHPDDDLSGYARVVAPSLPTRATPPHWVVGPRTGTHDRDFRLLDARGGESLPPEIEETVEWQGRRYPVRRWRENGDLAAGRIHFWPTLEFLRDYLGGTPLPEGVRLRRRGPLTFCFNRSERPCSAPAPATASFVLGQRELPPYSLAAWA